MNLLSVIDFINYQIYHGLSITIDRQGLYSIADSFKKSGE